MPPRYITPIDPLIAAKVAGLPEIDREVFEEAAAIREHMGGLGRREAEALAWDDLLKRRERNGVGDAPPPSEVNRVP